MKTKTKKWVDVVLVYEMTLLTFEDDELKGAFKNFDDAEEYINSQIDPHRYYSTPAKECITI